MTYQYCYICKQKLGHPAQLDKDHIIPNTFFSSGDKDRPKLSVHKNCHDSKKSMDDRWFVKRIQLMSSTHPEAKVGIDEFLRKAGKQRKDAFVIGKRISDYKLAKTVFNDLTEGIHIQSKGEEFVYLQIDGANKKRFNDYVTNMCIGLYMYYIADALPNTPTLQFINLPVLQIQGKKQEVLEKIAEPINKYGPNFVGKWSDRLYILGQRVKETSNKGYLYCEFYSCIGILAVFR